MRRVVSIAAIWAGTLCVWACSADAPRADVSLDIRNEMHGGGPGGPVETDAGHWGGPAIPPVPGAAWGGVRAILRDELCMITWSVVGEEVPCDDCAIAFLMDSDVLGDTCGHPTGGERFHLAVIDGRLYGFDEDWGPATMADGRIWWRGYSEVRETIEYYGYVEY